MMQSGGGLCFVLEPLKLPLVQHGCKRQHFQSDSPVERDLLRLVDDPHSAPADLAHDAEVAQRAEGRRLLHRGNGSRSLGQIRLASQFVQRG